MKKLIILVATLLLIVVLLTACTQIKEPPVEEKPTYKGLNGETITDLGEYGAQRIITEEKLDYKDYNVIELISADKQAKEFLIIFLCEGTAIEEWSYMYGWNDYDTVDDTWKKQDIWF